MENIVYIPQNTNGKIRKIFSCLKKYFFTFFRRFFYVGILSALTLFAVRPELFRFRGKSGTPGEGWRQKTLFCPSVCE